MLRIFILIIGVVSQYIQANGVNLSKDDLIRLINIDNKTLHERYRNAKPLCRNRESGRLHRINNEDNTQRLLYHAFRWDPELLEPPLNQDEYEIVTAIQTYHPYNSPRLFKPSVAEILAQIPVQLLEKKVYFEVILEDGGLQNQKYIGLGFHSAKTIFYRLKE